MFYGRRRELESLEKRYSGDSFEFIPIYGRRRVGKTALIKEFMRGKRGVFFTAKERPLKDNLELLAQEVFGYSDPVPTDLRTTLNRIRDLSKDERYILAIDEYPRLTSKDSGISSDLQEFIDEIHEDSKLFIILCGSSLSAMTHEMIGYTSPLYGRRTGSIDLQPFNYFESREFLEGFSEDDMVRIYGITGGIPLYLKHFRPDESLLENVSRMLEDDSFFRSEPNILMIQEVTNPRTCGDIINAVSRGYVRSGDIAVRIGKSTELTSKYISDLTATGILRKSYPVDRMEGKITRYELNDDFLTFYYRHMSLVDDAMSDNERLDTARRVLEDYENDLGFVFEKICAQYLKDTWGGKAEKWWGTSKDTKTTEEIDIVMRKIGQDAGIDGLFVECKYKNKAIGAMVLDKLVWRSGLVRGFDRVSFALCSKSGFTEDMKGRNDVLLLTLDDMVSGWNERHSKK